jgi:hypothetical protein
MTTIYISDKGDDKNDGLTQQTPIRSWHRYLKLKTGNDGIVILGDPEKTIRRLKKEIAATKDKRPM